MVECAPFQTARWAHCGPCKSDADGVTIKVSDNGVDIAADDIARVLELFGQIHRYSLRNHGVTGLGLTLSKLLTEMPRWYAEN